MSIFSFSLQLFSIELYYGYVYEIPQRERERESTPVLIDTQSVSWVCYFCFCFSTFAQINT